MGMLGLTGAIVKSNFMKLEKPYKLNFCITYVCQSRCVHCSIWQMKPKGELTLAEITALAKSNPYFSWISLTGGEPFLRSDIVDIAKAFKENCPNLFILTIPTNSLCSYEMEISKIAALAETGIPRIQITVSLDGYRELHDKIRGIPGNYERAIRLFKGIKQLEQTHPNLDCNFGYTIIKQNVGQLEKTVEMVRRDVPDAAYSDFHVNIGQLSKIYYGNEVNDIVADKGSAFSDVEFILKAIRGERMRGGVAIRARMYLEKRYLEGMLQFLKTGTSPVANRDGELSVYVDSFGNVFPSIMSSKKIGNLREDGNDITKIVKKEAAPAEAERHYTACEIYQSLLATIIRI